MGGYFGITDHHWRKSARESGEAGSLEGTYLLARSHSQAQLTFLHSPRLLYKGMMLPVMD